MESMLIGLVANAYIESMVENVRQKLKAEGYHHWKLDRYEFKYSAPNPSIFKLRVLLNKILVTGADKIEAKNIEYDPTTTSIKFEILLPELVIKSGKSSIVASLCDKNFDRRLSGRVIVNNLRILCKTELRITESKQLDLQNTEAKMTVGGMMSDIHFTFLDKDFSEIINTFLSVAVPEFIQSHGDKCKEILDLIKENATGSAGSAINNMF
ncbi:uncharacterized protein LOC115448808 isoform X1 [Manduca sexta]|uniref:uncharacterized protein LOC115448808 isoform X1 n=1 Tax=Manduca sexta TaxID=7130 RepID=UPI00188EB4A6|nr:uncharacterized protein LOC115448808 isoform X1 [Manduca sexta]